MTSSVEDANYKELMANSLLLLKNTQKKLALLEQKKSEPIAIIGMGCRFPGNVNNPATLWDLLINGCDATTEIPPERWNVKEYYDPDENKAGKMITCRGGFLSGIDSFDAQFFNISPREAVFLDPQQRLLLEVAWEALENANISADSIKGSKTGVFIGINSQDYLLAINELLPKQDISGYIGTGTSHSSAAGRLSYILDLTGPSLSIDTACSSSLVAVHNAVESLRRGECDLALVGGVNLILSPISNIVCSKARMLSPDGRCKPFADTANGYGRSEGVGVVVLKRLNDAIADNDNIMAQIRGSAINSDGASGGLTVPNGLSQQAVIRQALQNAHVTPTDIAYIEAHGTGTPLGDPIEIGALDAVFGDTHSQNEPLIVGSFKSNVGHMEAAAGIGSLIKLVLQLQHKEIPPLLHMEQPNPHIAWDELSIHIPTQRVFWNSRNNRRIAGVSSFGFSGTNAHVVVEEAPIQQPLQKTVKHSPHLLTLSAKTEEALKRLTERYENCLAANPALDLEDVCSTANTSRVHFNHRLSVLASSSAEMREKLTAFKIGREVTGVRKAQVRGTSQPKIAFLFTGQGSQYAGMGRQLYETQSTFRKVLEDCNEILLPYLEKPLLKVMYPETGENVLLNETVYAQPALFALEYALAQLWKSWGIEPSAVMGHSAGEYAAACVAGVFSLEDGLKLIALRGQLMQSLPQLGEMAVVFAGKEQVNNVLTQYGSQLAIAAVNGPENTVISGERMAVRSALKEFQSQGIATRALKVSHAFHSPLMEPILSEFERLANQVQFKAPRIALVSNLTGKMLKPGESLNCNYWVHQLRESVQFAQGMNTLNQLGYEIFLELGPSNILLEMGKKCLLKETGFWLSSLQRRQDDWWMLLNSLSILETQGVDVNWKGVHPDYQHRRILLPTYPFEGKCYWLKSDKQRDVEVMNFKTLDTPLSHLQVNTKPEIIKEDKIRAELRIIVARLLQTDSEQIDVQAPFLEMGADSIILLEAVQAIENTFGIKIAVHQLFKDLTTINALALYIAQNSTPETKPFLSNKSELNVPSLPPVELAKPTSASIQKTQDTQKRMGVPETTLERIMAQQLEMFKQLTSQQLETLQNYHSIPPTNHPTFVSSQELNKAIVANPVISNQSIETKGVLNSRQQKHLEALIARYTKRTQKSKQQKQNSHPILADSRACAGFRLSIKEMLYPIVGQRASGSKIWDLDGNEYVDITMGFGVHLFGHAPSFLNQVLEEQIKQGISIGPQSNAVAEVAELLCELTGMERVSFCNSGTEAVMTALRLARTATGRTKIALFANSYHGHVDGVLASMSNNQNCAVPMATGIPQSAVEDVLVLNYGNPESLEILHAHAHELAAVLVEPVQSRRPDLQPKEFLQQLRQLTTAAGIALIFDEVLLGFRIHSGGAQAWFGIEADLATYGKIIGGGLPIGVVAGKATYMNGIDGGLWNYGDISYPQAEKTFFAGTFNKNHFGMVAARAVLQHLKKEGCALQQRLNQKTAYLAETLNTFFEEEDVPIRIVHCGSLFRFAFSGNLDLLFYHLIDKGVYIWEGRNCFLSTAHTDDDINYVIRAVKDSVKELRSGGFLSEKQSSSLKKNNQSGSVKTAPLTGEQKYLWDLAQLGHEASIMYDNIIILRLRGVLDVGAIRKAIQTVVDRHEALRTNISSQGDVQYVLPNLTIEVPVIDFSTIDAAMRETKVAQQLEKEYRQGFDLTTEPLLRVKLLKLEEQHHLLVFAASHMITDGWSFAVLIQEISAFYSSECQGIAHQENLPLQFREYIQWQAQQSHSADTAKHEAYWLSQFADSIPALELPCDRPRPLVKTYKAAAESLKLEAELYDRLRTLSRQKDCTLFMTLVAAYMALMHQWTNQDDIVVATRIANRPLKDSAKTVGYCVNILPIRSSLAECPTFASYLNKMKHILLDAYANQDYPYAELLNRLQIHRDPKCPPIGVTFNLDKPMSLPQMFGLEIEFVPSPVFYGEDDIFFNLIELDRELLLEVRYSTDLFDATTIKQLLKRYQALLEGIAVNPEQRFFTSN
ncbi:hypothetical protein NUACC21_67770 [Scytonema sp. NUACC21]